VRRTPRTGLPEEVAMTNRRSALLERLGVLEFRLLEAGLLILLAINTVAIVSRYVLGRPLGSLFEIMVLGSVALYWLGAATAERVGGHIGMDFLAASFSPRWRRANDIFVQALVIAFLVVVVYSGYKLCRSQIVYGTHSGLLKIPMWLFSGFMPLAALLYLIRVVVGPSGKRPAEGTPV
jgi:TRAP-type C4-dicarboxylate transport system permease small subunit